jgi:transcriptional repressor NrdR
MQALARKPHLLLRPFSGTFATLPRPWPQVFSRARRSMHCPFCQHADTRVIDSRVSEDGATIRRRRECEACGERFSTMETVKLKLPAIVKSDGTREAFDQRKVRAGFDRALQKRAVAEDKIEAAVRAVVHQLRISGEREVPSIKVGEFVMNELRKLDHVGYVRFASVYRSFEDVADFREEIEKLERELPSSTEQLQLLGDVIALTKKKKG